VLIRDVTAKDAMAVCNIYNYYIENSVATFEEALVSVGEMMQRFEEITRSLPWLVFEQDGVILGYAYASPWKGRCAYRYSVETSVYLAQDAYGKGIGGQLYEVLLERMRGLGLHSAIAGITLPNEASVALHEKMGFKKVAHFEQVGYKMDRWIDVGYWQLLLKGATSP